MPAAVMTSPTSHLDPFTLLISGDHGAQLGLHGAGGDGIHDDPTGGEEGENSPDPQPQAGRRTRREACTCPYCKDSEGR